LADDLTGDASDDPSDAGHLHDPLLELAVTIGVLCNDADARVEDGRIETLGDPTETALLVVAHDLGVDVATLRASAPRIDERPFDSERKRMSTVHRPLGSRADAVLGIDADDDVVFVKGAVDGLLALATCSGSRCGRCRRRRDGTASAATSRST
jgi:Ca2+-transporting ATPase